MPPQTDIARALAHAIDGALWARNGLDVDLDDWQADVVREPGDQLLCVTRQGGKSNTVGIKALHHLLHVPAAFVIAASPSEDQSKELFRKLLGFYDRCPEAPRAVVRNTTELELANGPRCCAVPGSERTIRSKSAVTMVLLDEAARIEDSLIGAVCPMMAHTSGTLIAMSSPFGKRGWFYEQWKGGQGYVRVKRTAYEIPRISATFLEKERSRLGDLLFRQEYLCEFIDPGSSAFSSELVDACLSRDFEPFP